MNSDSMTSVEDQIRAAARATALEISNHDIPPRPDLRGRGRAWSTSRPSGSRRRVMRWAAPLTAAAAVAAVAAVAASLASGPSAPLAPSAHGTHKVSVSPAQTRDLKGLEQGVTGEFFPASGAQYTTGALFRGQYISLESREESTCMAGYGFRSPTTTAANAAIGDFDDSQYPDLALIARTHSLGAAQVWATPSGSKAFNTRMASCQYVAGKPFTTMENAALKLSTSFFAGQQRADSSSQVSATIPALRTCARRYGWPSQPYEAPDSSINSLADFVNWVAGHLDGAGSRGASGTQLATLQHHWSHVFVLCATPTVTALERVQLAQQANWMNLHQRQFQAVVALARGAFAQEQRQLTVMAQRQR